MNPDTDLDTGYRAMAADQEREAEAQAWCAALAVNDPHEREVLDWTEQVADTDGWTGQDIGVTQKNVNTEKQKNRNKFFRFSVLEKPKPVIPPFLRRRGSGLVSLRPIREERQISCLNYPVWHGLSKA